MVGRRRKQRGEDLSANEDPISRSSEILLLYVFRVCAVCPPSGDGMRVQCCLFSAALAGYLASTTRTLDVCVNVGSKDRKPRAKAGCFIVEDTGLQKKVFAESLFPLFRRVFCLCLLWCVLLSLSFLCFVEFSCLPCLQTRCQLCVGVSCGVSCVCVGVS